MKIRDERLEQNTNKIWSEMMRIVYLIVIASFLVKSIFLEYDLWQCFTEYIIVIGVPIYQMIRSRQLGVVLAAEPKKAIEPKRLLLCAVAGLVTFFFIWLIKGRAITPSFGIGFILTFLIVFILTRVLFVRMETKRLEKLEHEFDDEK